MSDLASPSRQDPEPTPPRQWGAIAERAILVAGALAEIFIAFWTATH